MPVTMSGSPTRLHWKEKEDEVYFGHEISRKERKKRAEIDFQERQKELKRREEVSQQFEKEQVRARGLLPLLDSPCSHAIQAVPIRSLTT